MLKHKTKTHQVKTRGGETLSVTVNERRSSKSWLEPFFGNSFLYATSSELYALVAKEGVLRGCEFMLKNGCEGNATHKIDTHWSKGDKVTYLVCKDCRDSFMDILTPLCNTGSKTTERA